jgi:hypothetical protein
MDEFNIDIEHTTRPSKTMDGSNTLRTPYLSINQPIIGEVITTHHPNKVIANPIEANPQPNSVCNIGAKELKLKITTTAQPIATPTQQAKTTYQP